MAKCVYEAIEDGQRVLQEKDVRILSWNDVVKAFEQSPKKKRVNNPPRLLTWDLLIPGRPIIVVYAATKSEARAQAKKTNGRLPAGTRLRRAR